MEGAGDRVQVYCRVRPPTAEDDGGLQRRCVSVHRDASQVVLHSASEEKTFTFDHAGDESTTQEDVFRSVGVPITEACMDGYNTTIFAYGQTGAGKTYTIVGPDADGAGGAGDCEIHEHSGLTPRVLTYIFAQIARIERTSAGAASFLCTCSYLEIYNENLTDLLRDSSAAAAGGAALAPRLREDLARGIYVENLETVDVATPREAMAVLAAGAANRRVAATSMNKESSRSHAVFTLTIASQTVAPSGLKSTRSSQFNLVDLAGSERQKDTGATGQRLTEACNINKSLSALGNVIMALVTLSNGRSRHVPYRDSKLTLLLKDSLGGNARTAIIANVSPLGRAFAETLSTLKFAQRAKMIRNNAVVNEASSGGAAALQAEIKRLRDALSLASAAGGGAHAEPPQVVGRSALERDIALADALERERALAERVGLADAQVALVADLAARHADRQRSLGLLVRLREAQVRELGGARALPSAVAAEAARAVRLAGGGAATAGSTPVTEAQTIAALQAAYDHHPDVVRLALEREELAAALAAAEAPADGEAQHAKLRRDLSNLKAELLRQLRESIALREKLMHVETAALSSQAPPAAGRTPTKGGAPADDDDVEVRALRAALAASEAAVAEARDEHERDLAAVMSGLAEADERADAAETKRRRTQAEMAAIVDEYEVLLRSVSASASAGAGGSGGNNNGDGFEPAGASSPGSVGSPGGSSGASARAAAAAALHEELTAARAALVDAEAARAELELSRARAEDVTADAHDRVAASDSRAAAASRAADAAEAEAKAAKAELGGVRAEVLQLEAALRKVGVDNDRLTFERSLLVDNNDDLLESAEFARAQLGELGAQLSAQRGRDAELGALLAAARADAAAAEAREKAAAEAAAEALGALQAQLGAEHAARADAEARLLAAADAAARARADAAAELAAATAEFAGAEQARAAAVNAALSAGAQADGARAAAADARATADAHGARLAHAEAQLALAAAAAAAALAAAAAAHAAALDAAVDAARADATTERDRADAEHGAALAAADEAHALAREAAAAQHATELAAATAAAGAAASAAAAAARSAQERAEAELERARAAAAEQQAAAERAHANALADALSAADDARAALRAADAAAEAAAADALDLRARAEAAEAAREAINDAAAATAARAADADADAASLRARAEAAETAAAAAEALAAALAEARTLAANAETRLAAVEEVADADAIAHAEELAAAHAATADAEAALDGARAAQADAAAAALATAAELADARAALAAVSAELAAARAVAATAAPTADVSAELDALRAVVREAADERRAWLADLGGLRERAAAAQRELATATARACAADAAAAGAAEALGASKAELAKLVGHQNPKQKIQLHVKIKEENNALQLKHKQLLDHARRLERLLAALPHVAATAATAAAGAKAKLASAAAARLLDGADKENGAANGAVNGLPAAVARALAEEEAADLHAEARAELLAGQLAAAEADKAKLSDDLERLVSFALRCVPAADASGASDGTRSALDASDASASLRLGAGGSTAEKVLAALQQLHAANGALCTRVEEAEHARRVAAEELRLRHLDSLCTPRRGVMAGDAADATPRS